MNDVEGGAEMDFPGLQPGIRQWQSDPKHWAYVSTPLMKRAPKHQKQWPVKQDRLLNAGDSGLDQVKAYNLDFAPEGGMDKACALYTLVAAALLKEASSPDWGPSRIDELMVPRLGPNLAAIMREHELQQPTLSRKRQEGLANTPSPGESLTLIKRKLYGHEQPQKYTTQTGLEGVGNNPDDYTWRPMK